MAQANVTKERAGKSTAQQNGEAEDPREQLRLKGKTSAASLCPAPWKTHVTSPQNQPFPSQWHSLTCIS